MDAIRFERICSFTLGRIFGYEPRIPQGIIDTFGSASAVFRMGRAEREEAFGPFSKISGKIRESELEACAKELDRLEAEGYRMLCPADGDYPSMLRECGDAPAGLFVRSGAPLLEIFGRKHYVSIVGTRDLSLYGREWCVRIVEALAGTQDPPTIVSGMALGVDITAHLAALERGIPTIGVLPTGIDTVYPASHRGHAGRIAAARASALVTDFPPGTAPQKMTFLRRNRIIAGMSSATILVESKARGGGMITAGLAAGYGRDVYALPGRIDDPRSCGCNILIGRKAAEAVYDLDALTEDLGLGKAGIRPVLDLESEIRAKYASDMPGEEVDALVGAALKVKASRGITVDRLAAEAGIPVQMMTVLTATLEGDGFIETDMLRRCTIRYK